jgi:hypothetical protein
VGNTAKNLTRYEIKLAVFRPEINSRTYSGFSVEGMGSLTTAFENLSQNLYFRVAPINEG